MVANISFAISHLSHLCNDLCMYVPLHHGVLPVRFSRWLPVGFCSRFLGRILPIRKYVHAARPWAHAVDLIILGPYSRRLRKSIFFRKNIFTIHVDIRKLFPTLCLRS